MSYLVHRLLPCATTCQRVHVKCQSCRRNMHPAASLRIPVLHTMGLHARTANCIFHKVIRPYCVSRLILMLDHTTPFVPAATIAVQIGRWSYCTQHIAQRMPTGCCHAYVAHICVELFRNRRRSNTPIPQSRIAYARRYDFADRSCCGRKLQSSALRVKASDNIRVTRP